VKIALVLFSPRKIDDSFYRWEGSGINEEGIDVQTGKTVVKVDSGYFRPAEVE
jgi:GDP-D-mannose dehydratase